MKLKDQKKHCRGCLLFKAASNGIVCTECTYHWNNSVGLDKPCHHIKKKKEDSGWLPTK